MRFATGILALVLAGTLVAVAGCGSSSDGSSSAEPSASTQSAEPSASTQSAEPVTITIEDFKYDVPGTVAPGAKITVTNEDSASHTVTADDDGGFDVTVKPGESATLTAPDKAGSYAFHCEFHANMHGKLVVR